MNAPNTIYLGGGAPGPGGQGGLTKVNDAIASVAIIPGMLVERDSNGKYKPHATSDGTFAAKAFALEQDEWNLGVDDAYAIDDLVKVGIMYPGSVVWALIPSGQNITKGDTLSSNGDGMLHESSTGVVGRALDTLGAITATTRCRVEVV